MYHNKNWIYKNNFDGIEAEVLKSDEIVHIPLAALI